MVNRRNNEARTHITVWIRVSLFSRFSDTNLHGTGSVKIWKTRHKNPWIYEYFLLYRQKIPATPLVAVEQPFVRKMTDIK